MYQTQPLRLIDVTLRDGGYVNNFGYSESQIIDIVRLLDLGKMTFIELGYCNGCPFDLGSCGLTANISASLVAKLKGIVKHAGLGVMAHPKNVCPDDMQILRDAGLDLVRICVTPDNFEQAKALITACKQMGLTVSANFVRMSRYHLADVINNMMACEQAGADMIYVADSLGNLKPKQVAALISAMQALLNCNLGFHAHDNLGMANFNTIKAIEHGATIIDSSLQGIGKGGGNLRTEVITHILEQDGIVLQDAMDLKYLVKAACKVQQFVIGSESRSDALFQTYLAIRNLSYEEGIDIRQQADQENQGNWVELISL
ncbi:MAG: hypothetical protein P8X74_00235 [Reinekea sp.]